MKFSSLLTGAAGVSLIDTLAKELRKTGNKYTEKMIIQYNHYTADSFKDIIIPLTEFFYKYDKDIYKAFTIFIPTLGTDRYIIKDKVRAENFKYMKYIPSDSVRVIPITPFDIVVIQFRAYARYKDSDFKDSGSMEISIIGKNRHKIKRKLEKIALETSRLDNFTIDDNGTWFRLDRNNNRNFDMIYSHQKEYILHRIIEHEKSKKRYASIGRKHKLTMLLYGEPGTGKSSMIEAIANYLHRQIRILRPETSTSQLLQTVMNGEFAIYVLEEVDLFFESEMQNSNMNTDNKSSTGSVNKFGKISMLMQILDGLYSKNGMFFIMTTNHIDKLDERLLRKGRIDVKVELTGLNEEFATKYCIDHGLTEEQTKNTLIELKKSDTNSEYIYNQSVLEDYILEHF